MFEFEPQKHFRGLNNQIEDTLKSGCSQEEAQRIEAALAGARKGRNRWWGRLVGELGIGYSLQTMRAGKFLKSQLPEKIGNIGEWMYKMPILLQLSSDIGNIARLNPGYNLEVDDVFRRYNFGKNVNSLERTNLLKGLAKSAGLTFTLQKFDYVLGYPLWLAIWTGIGQIPDIKNFTDQNYTHITAAAIGLMFTGVGIRFMLNRALLNRDRYSPDLLETLVSVAPGLVTGQRNEKHGKKTNTLAAGIGAFQHTVEQITLNTLPLAAFGADSFLAAWITNVVDEVFFASASGVLLVRGRDRN